MEVLSITKYFNQLIILYKVGICIPNQAELYLVYNPCCYGNEKVAIRKKRLNVV